MRSFRHVIPALAVVLAGASPLLAEVPIFLKASAGLNGVAKPGRWTPIRLFVESQGDVSGELIVTWGNAVVHRRVALAGPARQQLELYIRSSDPTDQLTIELKTPQAHVNPVEIPIRNLSPDDDVTLCAIAGSSVVDEQGCTIAASIDTLPRSFRGYDAVDRVSWRAGPRETLPDPIRTALTDWEAYHDLELSGMLSRTPRPTPESSAEKMLAPVNAAAFVVFLYLALMAAGGALARRASSRPLAKFAMLAAFPIVMSSITLALGRTGPGSTLVIRQHSTLLQLNSGRSVATLRGRAEYPAFDSFEIRAVVRDGNLERPGRLRAETFFDEYGDPILGGRFALGASEELFVDGVVDFAPLQVERHADGLRIRNISSVALTGCVLSDGLATQTIASPPPRQWTDVTPSPALDVPFVSCHLASSPVRFTEISHDVDVQGGASVSAYVPAAPSSTKEPR